MDRYIARSTIFKAIKWAIPSLSGKLLDIGCGKMPYKKHLLEHSKVESYIGLDIENALIYDETVKPDFTWNGVSMPFSDNTFNCAFGTEVLEHCPDPEWILKETNRVLKSGGTFFFTVPFLWNLHEVPNDEYRFTPFSLKRHLENSGFREIEIRAMGGWHHSMAQMLGLWVKRAPISKRKAKVLSIIILPIMKYLIKVGNREKLQFTEGKMITGLYGIARKK
jgi:ubiquinone/menaquinone biosynthesis C-methylase UbiE